MNEKLTTYDIAYIMKKFRLKSVEDFAEFGLTLKYIAEGCSRMAYYIRGYNLVVKIPFADTTKGMKSSIRHSTQEYKAFRKIANERVKKYKPLRKYLPKIHCMTTDGVILMDRYKPCGYRRNQNEIKYIRRLSEFLFLDNDGGTDMYGENLGKDSKGNIVILDFGCFFRW